MILSEIELEKILEDIHHLMEMRSQLQASDLSPEGAWIHQYVVRRRYPSGFIGEYWYAKWQAHEPIFKRNPKRNGRPPRCGKDPKFSCHLHIGRVSSNTGLGTEPEVEEAYQQWSNRKRLEAVELALQEIKSILSKFQKYSVYVMPHEANLDIT